MSKKPVAESRSIRELEATLRDARWIDTDGAVPLNYQATLEARRARRGRRVAAARAQLRRFSRRGDGAPHS
jgi:hypothetical protein